MAGHGTDDRQTDRKGGSEINDTSFSRESKLEAQSLGTANSVTLHYSIGILLLFPLFFPLNGVVVKEGGSF